jgi:antitoxin MazE
VKSEIIKIGNSQGVKIPQEILEQCGFKDTVELKVEGDRLIISPITNVREGWEESFQEMAANGDDTLLIDDAIDTEYDEEWQW